MGSFRLGDCLTGRAIPDHEPVVALVIDKLRGGYPDAEKAAAHRPIASTDIFVPVSLPIRGRVGSYGGIEPFPDQLAVALACRMTGVGSWEEFEKKAFDFSDEGGLAIQDDSAQRRLFGMAPPVRRIFGLTVFSEASWRHLQEAFGQAADREAHIATMKAVVADAADALSGKDSMRLGRAINILSFKTSGTYTMADGSEVDLPILSRALKSLDEGGAFSMDFSDWMDSRFGIVGPESYDEGLPPYFGELVEGLHDAQVGLRSLTWLNRLVVPSPAAGQRENAEDVAGVSLLMMRETIRDMAESVEEGMVEDLSAMRSLAGKLADLQAHLQARMEALPVDDHSGPKA